LPGSLLHFSLLPRTRLRRSNGRLGCGPRCPQPNVGAWRAFPVAPPHAPPVRALEDAEAVLPPPPTPGRKAPRVGACSSGCHEALRLGSSSGESHAAPWIGAWSLRQPSDGDLAMRSAPVRAPAHSAPPRANSGAGLRGELERTGSLEGILFAAGCAPYSIGSAFQRSSACEGRPPGGGAPIAG